MRQPNFAAPTSIGFSLLCKILAAAGFSIAMLLSACSSAPRMRASFESEVDHSGRMRGYVESSKVTDFCPDQSTRRDDERCTVTRGFDYSRVLTIVRTYDPTGKLINSVDVAGADLSLTDVERARIETLIRADPRTKDIVNAPGVMLWDGGFVMREPGDQFCDRGSRCIRVIAATHEGDNAILHSVVDLVADRVVYPSYTSSRNKSVNQPLEH